MEWGRFRIASINAGTFYLDGGAMFGVVPKMLWQARITNDAQNRVRLATRLLLVIDDAASRVFLFDTGIGDKLSPKLMQRFGVELPEGGLLAALARHGVAPESVTDVILTHLHFDHVGGATMRTKAGLVAPTFPRATYHLQRRALSWACCPTEKDRASFYKDDFEQLERLSLLDGPTELCADLSLLVSDGHTVGQQLPLVRNHLTGQKLWYCGDLIPTSHHVRLPWIMAYDLYPLTTLEEKRRLLAQALAENWVLFFEHDPDVLACTVREQDGEVVVGDLIAI